MQFELFQHLNNYSLKTIITDPESESVDRKKSERIAIKDLEWPEIHTCITSGYVHLPAKLGFDGYDESRQIYCEVKSSSKVINKDLIAKFHAGQITQRNEFIDNPIDGRGVFSQFTHDAHERYSLNNVQMLISAYINGVLMFIIEFPFLYDPFKDHLKRMLEKSLPNGDKPGRSKTISFTYTQYKDCKDARLLYLTPEDNHQILKGACTRNFYSYLQRIKKS